MKDRRSVKYRARYSNMDNFMPALLLLYRGRRVDEFSNSLEGKSGG